MWKATFTNIAELAGNATRLFQMSPPECHQAQISPYDVAIKRLLPVKFVSAECRAHLHVAVEKLLVMKVTVVGCKKS